MLGNLSWEHMLVLVVVGLVILGPERLPGAIRWTAAALGQARAYLSGMSDQLREDLGPEFEDLRAPLSELQKLRGMTPRAALTKHLLDGDGSVFSAPFEGSAAQNPPTPQPSTPQPSPPQSAAQAPGPAPFDPDAT